ncbi:MAG TPA: alpha/beta hydrolase [Edaphocola sp.]|nr:alpha/beta hydrolase [Edaphocola sp.]
MSQNKIQFLNEKNEILEGFLELPDHQEAHNFVLFAHCFTCSKDLTAISVISHALTKEGLGVLRFDFTGLGESQGEFEDSNFSTNISDLLCAGNFLIQNYKAPTVIIGHSLGGAAVIFAASKLASIKSVVTIGAPANPLHVKHLIKDEENEIMEEGEAEVNIAGRNFTIKKQFLDDLLNYSLLDIIPNLRKSLLIFHSPQDEIVGIENAEKIFKAAFHPKSFISLDGAPII